MAGQLSPRLGVLQRQCGRALKGSARAGGHYWGHYGRLKAFQKAKGHCGDLEEGGLLEVGGHYGNLGHIGDQRVL